VTDQVWVDTHGHLFLLEDSPADVLARAAAAGVQWVMCPGIDLQSSHEAAHIAADHPDRVIWSAGLHPHSASMWPVVEDDIAELAERAAAIGECGLDWYRNLAPRDQQIQAFSDQLDIAARLSKPIIIHCRDAFADVYEMVGEADLGERAVLHCWSGGPKWTKRFRDLGVTFSFAGALTYTTADTLRLGAAQAPPERTMVETDSPYLTPEPKRSELNEPANVPLTGAVLADVWGVATSDVARLTTETAARVFGAPQKVATADDRFGVDDG
jgi:TatD DNase family protein